MHLQIVHRLRHLQSLAQEMPTLFDENDANHERPRRLKSHINRTKSEKSRERIGKSGELWLEKKLGKRSLSQLWSSITKILDAVYGVVLGGMGNMRRNMTMTNPTISIPKRKPQPSKRCMIGFVKGLRLLAMKTKTNVDRIAPVSVSPTTKQDM